MNRYWQLAIFMLVCLVAIVIINGIYPGLQLLAIVAGVRFLLFLLKGPRTVVSETRQFGQRISRFFSWLSSFFSRIFGPIFRWLKNSHSRVVNQLLRWTGPQNYFIAGLSPEQKSSLISHHLRYQECVKGGQQGIRIRKQYLNLALQVLSAKHIAVHLDGYFEAVLHFPPPPDALLAKLSVGADSVIPQWEKVEQLVRQILVPAARTDVLVWTGAYNYSSNPQHLNIILNSSGSGSRAATGPPSTIFGIAVEPATQRQGSFMPWFGQGTLIIDKTTGYVVAQLIGNRLYIHHQLFTAGTPTELAIFSRILQLAVKELVPLEDYLSALSASFPAGQKPNGGSTEFSVSTDFTGSRHQIATFLAQKILTPAVGRNIAIYANEKKTTAEPHFSIIFKSSLSNSGASVPVPNKLWGHELNYTQTGPAPSGMGLSILDDSGFTVAELSGNDLHVHCEFFRYGSRSEAAIFARLLHDTALLYTQDNEQAIEQYAGQCWKRIDAAVGTTSRGKEVKAAQEAIHSLLSDIRFNEQYLFRLELSPTAGLGLEYDQLLRIPKVREVNISDGSVITVVTDLLYCRHPATGRLHEIGAFKITLNMSSYEVHWLNTTRRIDGMRTGMHAPHIWAEGIACLGNTASLFPDLLRQRQLSMAIELAIAFVESVNITDGAGKYLGNWPTVSG